MQQRLCAQARTGLHYEALHDESHRQVGGILRELGGEATARTPRRAASRAPSIRHGLGHSLGLQVHDVGCATTKTSPRQPVPAEHDGHLRKPMLLTLAIGQRNDLSGEQLKDLLAGSIDIVRRRLFEVSSLQADGDQAGDERALRRARAGESRRGLRTAQRTILRCIARLTQ